MENLDQNIIYWHPHPNHERIVHANKIHRERSLKSFNRKFAVFLTKNVGSMWTAYSFVVLAFIGLASILGYLSPSVVIFVAWLSQTFIQLVLLPVIMVGQNVLNEHNETQAEVTFLNTKESLEDERKQIEHLNAQDAELLKQTKIITEILEHITEQNKRITKIQEEQEKLLEMYAQVNKENQEQKPKRVYRTRREKIKEEKMTDDE
jgi:uncharacterized membrane-anchored protein YhcB (DUF1043 family)